MDDEFKNLVAVVLKVNPADLDVNTTAGTVPEWDSLSHWLVIGELEAHYCVEFSMAEATCFKNLGDIYRTLMRKIE